MKKQGIMRTHGTWAQTALVESLEWTCGMLGARHVVTATLADAARYALPEGREEMIAFVRVYVTPMLHHALGARDTSEFLQRFAATLDRRPSAPASGVQRVAASELAIESDSSDCA